MRFKVLGVSLILAALMFTNAYSAPIGRRTFGEKEKPKAMKQHMPTNGKEKPYKELVKDMVEIEGLFTFYHDTVNNKMLMAIKPDQFGPLYLCNMTRSQAEGAFFDNGSMAGTFPFYFKRVGKNIMMMEKNLRIRANEDSPMFKAVEHGISDGLYGSTDVLSQPDDSTKAILIDPANLFLHDAENLSFFLGQAARLGIRYDAKNSYFGVVKSFPENTEIDVHLHYMTSQPVSAPSLEDPYSMYHVFHYSLSNLKSSPDFVPRPADDRVGYFMTMYEDYTNLDTETPYVRYINHWNLHKKDPDAALSEPTEPIVYWIENTTPVEYRDAIAKGIEFWNQSFEKIGLKNVMVAKVMPDTASWDPADVRYNTVRWIVIPGGGYAVGPSRANPYTGEIYDADIRVSSDFVRYMFNNMQNFIQPVAFNGKVEEKEDPMKEFNKFMSPYLCQYGEKSSMEAAFGLSYTLSTINTLADKDSLTKEYVNSYLTELVAHEVGHTLGFRHNFKASTIYSLDQIQNRDFTKAHGIGGTVMDYDPPNLAPTGQPQGEFYMSSPGPYDDWVIEYGYKDFGDPSPQLLKEKLNEIASRSAEPGLAYGTDEDAFGSSSKSIDPYCNLFDLGNDPIKFCEHKIALTNQLWRNSIKNFEKDGTNYHKLYTVFQTGWRSYIESARTAVKYVGGIKHYRAHIGDPNSTVPFVPVNAADQRRAIKFLTDKIFAPDAFVLPADLWNKLQPERLPDFLFSVYSVPQVDYPIHQMALLIQNQSLMNLYGPYILGRLLNNQERVKQGEDRYTMYDMFRDVRQSIWSEITGPSNVNSFRRQLQLSHLNRLISIYLSSTAIYPHDALTLAANDLDILLAAAKKAVNSTAINSMTKAHYKEVIRQIEAAQGSKRNYSFLAP